MITAAVISYASWVTLDSYFGSPKPTELKAMSGQTAFLFWVTINEPDGQRDAGSICMWLRPAREASPKLYQFPYSRSLHETSQGFLDEILKNNGSPIQIAFTNESKQGEQATTGNGNGVRPPNGGARGKLAYQSEPRVYELPPVKLPDKMTK
ncbi:MAG: hypothetical protein JO271_13100 [Verrucomicrobia bacterium]|nr:hypothetical protein [Verrucomicrobiota bacterium]MBV9274136.1 hypothetical protein [Verrucomicrobiota bacterium]